MKESETALVWIFIWACLRGKKKKEYWWNFFIFDNGIRFHWIIIWVVIKNISDLSYSNFDSPGYWVKKV